ncbi:hypothetical protein LTR17_023552 [Elasticomyces elasticus]|nr:hypothetical protein LTR17_023552 [Elasticomyces elasticus]
MGEGVHSEFWAEVNEALSGKRSASTVDYESPYLLSAPAGASGQSGRSSLEAQASATRQGLPSPAPSDDLTSPIITDGSMQAPAIAPRRGPGRPPKNPVIVPSNASPTMSHPQQAHRQNSFPRQQRTLSGPVPPRLQTQGNGSSPLQMAQTHQSVGAQPNGQQRVPSGRPPVFVPPNGQPSPGVPMHFARLFNPVNLLGSIGVQLRALMATDPNCDPYRIGQSRLQMLQEAVQKHDSFYLVLSQLYCLRTTSPSSLPQAVRNVPAASWTSLEGLLCPNHSLYVETLTFLAEFPVPIMTIYSSSELPAFKTAYEVQVRAVADFLTKLPLHWQAMRDESNARQAAPLVQEMVERLSLHSPVLQTTAFRAIARSYFADKHLQNQEGGIDMLVKLHRADQTQYHSGMRRSEEQTHKARFAYRLLLNSWVDHDRWAVMHAAKQNNPNYEFYGQPLAPFHFPPECLSAFGLVLSNRNTPTPQPQQQQPQQQQHGHPPQQRQSSMGGQSSGSRTPLQQSMTMTPAQSLAQQQSWIRSLTNGTPVSAAGASTMPYQRPPPPHIARLIPAEGSDPRPQPTHPESARSALHQAHLRDPTLTAAKVGGKAQRLYRQVSSCYLGPTRIRDTPLQLFAFEAGPECKDVLPKQASGSVAEPSVKTLTEASLQYRLRCCKHDKNVGFQTLSSWVEADNVWPDTVYFDLNGEMLEPRKKLQHGRYLPIDLTHLVRPGRNELKVTVNRESTDKSEFDYAVAVEIVSVVSHETLVSTVNTIDAKESLASIKQSLSGSGTTDEDDDDIMMVSNSLTIKLFDPMAGNKIFDTPVRGESCLHRDPFDLEVFLSTREPRLRADETPSAVDTWKCPICRKDARPQVLIQDGFLVDVRRQLKARGLLDTKAIVVDPDGSWKVKGEERTGVRSRSLEREEMAKTKAKAVKKPPPIVIEID